MLKKLLKQMFVVVLLLASWSAAAGTLKVDASKSELVVILRKEGVAAAAAHDHVVRAADFSGTVLFDSATPDAAQISVEAKTAGLKIDEPNMRKKYSLKSELTDKERTEVEQNMRADSQLATTKYPTITFKSTKIIKQGDSYIVNGTLTIRGKSNPVSFKAAVEMKDGNFTGKGSFTFKQSSFGYEPYSALFGALRNQDVVTMHLTIVAAP